MFTNIVYESILFNNLPKISSLPRNQQVLYTMHRGTGTRYYTAVPWRGPIAQSNTIILW